MTASGGVMRSKAIRLTGRCGAVAGTVLLLGACATTPEEDPVLQGKLYGISDARTANIERVVQNQEPF